ISQGSLPPGLTLTKGPLLSGTPTQAGAFSFTVQVTDSSTPQPQVFAQTLVADVLPKPKSVNSGFFAMHVTSQNDPWPTNLGLHFASWRSLSGTVDWYEINPAEGVYNWSGLDVWLNKAATNGQSVMYTLYRTPQWASSDPSIACTGGITGVC